MPEPALVLSTPLPAPPLSPGPSVPWAAVRSAAWWRRPAVCLSVTSPPCVTGTSPPPLPLARPCRCDRLRQSGLLEQGCPGGDCSKFYMKDSATALPAPLPFQLPQRGGLAEVDQQSSEISSSPSSSGWPGILWAHSRTRWTARRDWQQVRLQGHQPAAVLAVGV